MKKWKIDKEFKELIAPLSKEEREQLEKNLLEDGCREPLVTWNGIIIDGHNRYEICRKHNIPFKTIALEFGSRQEVLTWMLKNQLGRRNLTDFQRNEMALKYEQMIAAHMKEKQSEAGGDKKSEKAKIAVDQMIHSGQKTTKRKELAKIAGTSEGSIQRTKKILEEGTKEQIDRARKGGKGNTISAISKEIQEEKKPVSAVGTGENTVQTERDGLDMKSFEADFRAARSALYVLIEQHREELARKNNRKKLTKLMSDFAKLIDDLR